MNTAAQLPLHINTYSGLIATSWQLMANISAAQKPTTKIGKKNIVQKEMERPFSSGQPTKRRNDIYTHYPRDRIQPFNHFLSNF